MGNIVSHANKMLTFIVFNILLMHVVVKSHDANEDDSDPFMYIHTFAFRSF